MKQLFYRSVIAVFFLTAMLMLAHAEYLQYDAKAIATSVANQCVSDADAVALKGKTLIVTSFTNKCEDEDVNVSVLQDKFITAFVKAKFYKIVERDRLDAALKEIRNGGNGLFDPKTQQELGKFLNAEYIMLGTVSGVAGDVSVDCKIMRIKDTELVIAADYPNENVDKQKPPVHDSEGTKVKHEEPPVAEPVDEEGETVTALVSWASSEMIVTNTAMTRPQAIKDSVRWLIENKILGDAQDVYAIWKPEIEQKIYSLSDKFITEITPRNDAYYIKINFAQIVREMVGIIFGKVTPRVAVNTKETIIMRVVPDPAVQTVVAAALLNYRFQVVDPEQAEAALLREAILQTDNGDIKSMNLVKQFAGELKADIFALGDSFAQQRLNRDGFDARVEYRLTEGATARLIASIDSTLALTAEDEPKLDPTGNVLAKKSLQKCAEKTIVRMVSEILKAYGMPVFRIRVWKISDFNKFDLIQSSLKDALPGCVISDSNFDGRSTKSGTFSIRTKRDAREVAAVLQKLGGLSLNITGVDCRSITCDVIK